MRAASRLFLIVFSISATLQAEDNDSRHRVKHVLLISVDGMHALDLTNYVSSHPQSTLAQLSSHGVTFDNAATSQPSDSFPGLSALVTGGSPTTAGFWYDVTYNRKLSPPALTTPYISYVGAPGGPCPGQIGTITEFDESIDTDLTKLYGSINPNFLPRDPNRGCAPVYPHEYLRVNTIFEVVKAHGGYTAWTDKHPAYEWTNGPSGQGVDDFFGPEINSIPVALPFPGCTPVPAPDTTPDDGWTTDLKDIQCYDQTHVQAVLNRDQWLHARWIPARAHPNVVRHQLSVGQRRRETGGQWLSGCPWNPFPGLLSELDFVDNSLGQMVSALKNAGIYDETLIIIGAKHGQSPIDQSKKVGIGGGQPATLINTIASGEAFDISDDGSLIWLNDSSQAAEIAQTAQHTGKPGHSRHPGDFRRPGAQGKIQ